MSHFLIYDPNPATQGFYKTIVKRVLDVFDAKHWKRKQFAIAEASLMNTVRNVPPGHKLSGKYKNLPNAEVVEFDGRWVEVARHPAPPEYISINTKG